MRHEQKVIPDPIYPAIGKIIRTRRKALKLTQEQLADALAISRGSLANIEVGRQNLLVHQLYNIADALKLKRTDLLPDRIPEQEPARDWGGLPLPGNLKSSQKDQIARLIEETPIEITQPKEAVRGKSNKR